MEWRNKRDGGQEVYNTPATCSLRVSGTKPQNSTWGLKVMKSDCVALSRRATAFYTFRISFGKRTEERKARKQATQEISLLVKLQVSCQGSIVEFSQVERVYRGRELSLATLMSFRTCNRVICLRSISFYSWLNGISDRKSRVAAPNKIEPYMDNVTPLILIDLWEINHRS